MRPIGLAVASFAAVYIGVLAVSAAVGTPVAALVPAFTIFGICLVVPLAIILAWLYLGRAGVEPAARKELGVRTVGLMIMVALLASSGLTFAARPTLEYGQGVMTGAVGIIAAAIFVGTVRLLGRAGRPTKQPPVETS